MNRELTTLVFTIDNKTPVELLSLTHAMLSVSAQFDKFNIKHGHTSEAKLYVKEVRKGSIILELFDIAVVSAIPFVENVNTVAEFAKHLQKVFTFFKNGGTNEDKPELTAKDCDDFYNIINPVALDSGANLTLNVSGNSNCKIHISIPSLEANAMQNRFRAEKEVLRQKELKELHHKQILTFSQAADKRTGNKGIIESLNEKPLGLIFENEEDREKILAIPTQNPLKYAFIVDVRVEFVGNRPSAYRILKYYDQEGFEL